MLYRREWDQSTHLTFIEKSHSCVFYMRFQIGQMYSNTDSWAMVDEHLKYETIDYGRDEVYLLAKPGKSTALDKIKWDFGLL